MTRGHTFVKKMMALPFLPEREIRPMFDALRRGVGNTNRLCRIRIQYLDQRQHLGSNRLDMLQTGHPNEQRHGRLAQWPKSPSFWKSTTAHVLPNPASLQGSETNSDPDPPGIREEAATNPAMKA